MRAATVISHVRTLLGDPDGDYHSDEKMLLHLNAALEDICDRSRSLRSPAYHRLIADQSMYGLPASFLEADIVGVVHQGQWKELQYSDLGPTLPAIIDDVTTGLAPGRYTIWGQAHIEKHVATVVENRNTNDPSGETSFTSSVPLSGVLRGDRVINFTDDSEGIVQAVSSDFLQVTFEDLAGGDDNRMEIGDEFRILSPEASRKNLVISPPPTISDEVGTESLFLYFSRSHPEMTQCRIDDKNDTLEIDPEFASTLRHRVSYYASLDEKGIDHPATQAYDIKYETDYSKGIIPVRRRIREFISSWRAGGRNRSIRGSETISRTADWNLKPY
ncbi:MAG: hypothetical protein OXN27_04340 [Candidatus Poribacteria bacterium]|nr:hypothetical protein [Candidatus Poribacteria bacterium]